MFFQDKDITKFMLQLNKKESDTGSTEFQCALFTKNIYNLTEHLKHNKKDHPARRSLIKYVFSRKRLLKYLYKKDSARCISLMKEIDLKKI